MSELGGLWKHSNNAAPTVDSLKKKKKKNARRSELTRERETALY